MAHHREPIVVKVHSTCSEEKTFGQLKLADVIRDGLRNESLTYMKCAVVTCAL